ncbi:HAMP domain-containing sensor histidine kinase [Streptomyces sp. TG1A-8]|uniref:histidine kinase dimerization/phospho-acceptor domain-containing protein n=1 Tax=Streptomyces sp. TG1A-8 TaxID=3051385 RepID=UPI00265C7FB7|nr:HAMP domain-containing sensor histidine kinase [Streptomyces sp. TG1A-8]MDO0929443.1 HAMP domain-containing sensor histidine kinase [Streptomyces sp. TG1A-8]
MRDRIEAATPPAPPPTNACAPSIADASHELRTPLFGIKGFTELYRMGGMPLREDVGAAMSRVERGAARLVRIVEDLLLLARPDEQATAEARLPLRPTPMDLRTLAVDALHDLRALAPERPATPFARGPGAARISRCGAGDPAIGSRHVPTCSYASSPPGSDACPRQGRGERPALSTCRAGQRGGGARGRSRFARPGHRAVTGRCRCRRSSAA